MKRRYFGRFLEVAVFSCNKSTTCTQAQPQAYYNEGHTIGQLSAHQGPSHQGSAHQGPTHQGPTTPYLGSGGLLRGQTAQPQVAAPDVLNNPAF
jgi:hypothetical protein